MIRVVPAVEADAEELSGLINAIIVRGGTTAYQTPHSAKSFASYYITGTNVISCFKATDEAGQALGFQGLAFTEYVPEGWGDIGTFTRIGLTQGGVGTALFAATKDAARERGIPAITAIIRADNTGGLAYYSKMGFVDYDVLRDIPLQDGTRVDRICKRFDL